MCHPEADNELGDEECSSDTYNRQKQIEGQPHIVSLPKLFLLGGLVHMSNFLSACNGVDEFSRRLPDNYVSPPFEWNNLVAVDGRKIVSTAGRRSAEWEAVGGLTFSLRVIV